MNVYFEANCSPTKSQIDDLARATPSTPFNTSAYAAAVVGAEPCTLLLLSDDKILSGCLGFVRTGRWYRTLQIVTAPPLEQAIFWNGVMDFCISQRVWDLNVQSFASRETNIPSLPGEMKRRLRCEFLLDLTRDDPLNQMSTGHRRNVRRAVKAGLQVDCTREPEAAKVHHALMQASMRRRQKRGEDVSAPENSTFSEALVRSGAGELYQVTDNGDVLSSIMILRSAECAYYHSAGTSPHGMKVGASIFLISQVASILQAEGVSLFNLGGASHAEHGLQRFKKSFGSDMLTLEAATFSLVSPVKRKVRTAVKLMFTDPVALITAVISIERYCAYSACPTEIPEPVGGKRVVEPYVFSKLEDEELTQLSTTLHFREQFNRFQKLGINSAYGMYVKGQLAHVAWLIDHEMDRNNRVRNVRVKPGEAEITHCLTSPEYRGRGIYSQVIFELCNVAARNRIKKVYMITDEKNLASRRGIEKAGFLRCGTICRIVFPFGPDWLGITWRGHRWNIGLPDT